MAKTFSELQALALQIRDEILEKKNTAPRVGAALLDMIDNTIQNITDINQKLSVFEHVCSGFKRVQSESQLPVTPPEDEKAVGYLVGKNLYLYVGKDGNAVNGRYFNVGDITGPKGEIGPQGIKGDKGDKGEQGNSGLSGSTDNIEVVNNLDGGESTLERIKVLAAEQGKVLNGKLFKLKEKTTLEISRVDGKINSYEQINYELTVGLESNNDYIYFDQPYPAFYLLGILINSFENQTLDNLSISILFSTGGSIKSEIEIGKIKYTQPTQPYTIKGLSIFSSGAAMGKKLNFSLILPNGINIASIKQSIKLPITDNFAKDVPQTLDGYPKGSSFYLNDNFTSTRFSNYNVYAISRTKAELENVTTPSAGLGGGGTINGNGRVIKGALFEVTGDYSFENCIFESCCLLINSVLGKIKFKAKNCIFLNSSIEHNTTYSNTDYIYPISLDVQNCEFSYTDDYDRGLTFLLRGLLVENSIIANNRFYINTTKTKPRNILMDSCVNSLFINNSFDGGVTGIIFMGQDSSSKLAEHDGMYIVGNNVIAYNRFVNIEEENVTLDHGGRRAIKTSINTCTIISKTIEQLIEGNNQREFCRKATIKLKVADPNFIHRVGCVMSVLLKDYAKDYSTIREITRNESDTDYTLFDVVADGKFFYNKYYDVVRDLPTLDDGISDGILISVPYINNIIEGNVFITNWAAVFLGGSSFGNTVRNNKIIGSGDLIMINVNDMSNDAFPNVTRGVNISNNICPDSNIRIVDFNKWPEYLESQGIVNLSDKTMSDVIIMGNYYNKTQDSDREFAENIQDFANITRSGELPS